MDSKLLDLPLEYTLKSEVKLKQIELIIISLQLNFIINKPIVVPKRQNLLQRLEPIVKLILIVMIKIQMQLVIKSRVIVELQGLVLV